MKHKLKEELLSVVRKTYSLSCVPFRIPVLIILDRKHGITAWIVSKMLHLQWSICIFLLLYHLCFVFAQGSLT